MKLTKTKRSHAVAFNITPMIDIVFLLIIFFMTVSQITRVIDQPMSLPVVNSAASEGTTSTVTINFDATGEIIVSGEFYSLQRTVQILQNKIDQLDGNLEQLKIELRCDRRCPSQYVNRMIEKLTQLGIQYVKIAVTSDN